MANYTPNFELEKPLPEEPYNIQVFNANADKVDAAIKAAGQDIPPGASMDFYGEIPPAGFLLCQGQAVSRNTYAALYAVIGTQYGLGDGTTTFNLPDRRGKVSVGYDPVDADFDSLGKKEGAKAVKLAIDHLPTGAIAALSTSVLTDVGVSGALSGYSVKMTLNDNTSGVWKAGLRTQDVNSKGLGTAVKNLQPYIICNQIIKY